jgi:hypothetical protein
MLTTSCHCGAVQIELARRPRSITECNCSLCRRYGARWAYYSRRSTRVISSKGALERYAPRSRLHFARCRTCGCVLLWQPIKARADADRVGINMRLIDRPEQLANARVHRFDGARTWRTVKYCTLLDPQW